MKPDRRVRLYIAMTLICGTCAFLLITLREDMQRIFPFSPVLYTAMIIAFVVYAVAPLLMLYLRGSLSLPFIDRVLTTQGSDDSPSTRDDGAFAQVIDELQSQVRELRRSQALRSKTGGDLTEADKIELLASIRQEFAAVLIAENEKQKSEAVAQQLDLVHIRKAIDSAMNRLVSELGALTRRGNLNLVIGTLTTLVAIGLLIYMVQGHTADLTTMPTLLSYYIPRISTVVFVELFGFFFLRLYKAGLGELKYYQNELTTLATFSIAVDLTVRDSATNAYGDFAMALLACDRNRAVSVANKGDSPDQETLKTASSVIQELAKLIPGGSSK